MKVFSSYKLHFFIYSDFGVTDYRSLDYIRENSTDCISEDKDKPK